MESPSPHLRPTDSPSGDVRGELVLLTGRNAGVCRPISPLLTLIGRSPECDIRINVEGVQPLHVALLAGPQGMVLRDLSTQLIPVNDLPVSSCLLVNGDEILIGPFRFRFQGPSSVTADNAPETVARQGELEALRIQATAVSAQQAALLEEEGRLQQRRSTLEKQEAQLSALLEERRRNLLSAEEELQAERETLRQEQETFRQEQQTQRQAASIAQAATAQSLREIEEQKQRLLNLRRRLWQRWRKHLHDKEQSLARRQRTLSDSQEQLRAEQAQLMAERLRFNGEVELGRRQLQDGWSELDRTREAWSATRAQEQNELTLHRLALEQADSALVVARDALIGQQMHAQKTRDRLEKEVEGLEQRVRHLRARLTPHVPTPTPTPSASPTSSTAGASGDYLEPDQQALQVHLSELAGELADQRVHLVEQWQRFASAQAEWASEHASLLPQLEQYAHRLILREQELDRRHEALNETNRMLLRGLEMLAGRRTELEAWQARLGAAEAQWRNERLGLLAQIEEREKQVEARLRQLDQWQTRWTQRQKDEFALLGRELRRCRDIQHAYAHLRADYEQRADLLAEQERSLAEWDLTVEQSKLELIGGSPNSAAVERKIQKIHKTITRLHADAEEHLQNRRKQLEQEQGRLSDLGQHLYERAAEVTAREEALAHRQTDWEKSQALALMQQRLQQAELIRLQQQLDYTSRHRRELQEEIDRIVRLLLEEAPQKSAPMLRVA